MTTPLTIEPPESAAVAGERAAVGVQPLVSCSCETAENCKKCGKPIAAIKKDDAYCCACLYGTHASRGYQSHASEMDVVEWMASHYGYRMVRGMGLNAIHGDESHS